MNILVAMSGGIDSSVVAHMLSSQGHNVVGVRFTLWSDPLAPALSQVLPSKCCNAQTAARASAVANNIGMDLHILDLQDEFKHEVVDPFLEEYKKGFTPNPCIGCNRTIKFGKLITFADQIGCEKLATGHYARIDGTRLFEAIDKRKDQSYYLYGLNQKQIGRCVFPLGSMMKKDVFALAKKYDIPYEDVSYRESQDLCFFPEKEPREFLKRHLKKDLIPGKVMRKNDGKVIGTHEGIALYTIGQRRIKIGGNRIPLEVVQKDCTSNTLIVDNKGSTKINELNIRSIKWMNDRAPTSGSSSFECRTRSHGQKHRGMLQWSNMKGIFRFFDPISPQSPGQHMTFYNDEEVLGGGEIV